MVSPDYLKHLVNKNSKCPICGEEFLDDGKQDTGYTKKGEVTCYGCYESSMDSAMSITLFTPDSVEHYTYSEDFEMPEDGGHIIKSMEWKSTSGWRGYYDWKYQPQYTEITEGWVTSMPDDTCTRKMELADIYKDLLDRKLVPPAPIGWAFARTSNVFSTASSMFVAKDDYETIKDWLEENGIGIKDLEEKFN